MIDNDPKLKDIVQRIVDAVHPTRIYLFGSRARGELSVDADYDILILKRGRSVSGSIRRKMLSRIRQGLWDIDAPIDILVYTETEFSEWRDYVNHPLGHAAREGKVIYETT